MSEMIERMTRAIFEEMDLADGLDVPVAERYAHAALKSILEPTDLMCEAGADGFSKEPFAKDGSAHYIQRQRNAWRAMVAEALSRPRAAE